MNLWHAIFHYRNGQNRLSREAFWVRYGWRFHWPKFIPLNQRQRPKDSILRSSFDLSLYSVILISAILSQAWEGVAESNEIRLSFLRSDQVVADTLDRLSLAGCDSKALAAVKALALNERNNRQLLSSRRLADDADFYSFDGLADFLAFGPPVYPSLVRSRSENRMHSLTCFDVAALILRDGPVTVGKESFDHRSENLAVLSTVEEKGASRFLARSATSFDYVGGVGLLTPIVSYRRLTGLSDRSSGEENLALTLRAPHSVPGHYANAELPIRRLMGVRMKQWEKDDVVFSEKIQVVLSHYVDLKGRFVAADHIALALPLDTGWMLLEKNGTLNPLVRIEFPTLDALADYAMSCFDSDVYDPASPLHEAAYLVTANDRILRVRTRQRLQEISRE